MNISRRTTIAAAIASAIGLTAMAMNAREPASTPAASSPPPALSVELETPSLETLPISIAANGYVAAWQEASVGAEVNGVRLGAVLVNVGDAVSRGQVLARFVPDTLATELAELEAAIAEAEANALDAADNAARARALEASGALSAQQVNRYLTAERTSQARLAAQRAAAETQRLRLSRTAVVAPEDGVISARSATPGAVPAPGQELFRLIVDSRLEWRAEVTPEEAIHLAVGTQAVLDAPDGRTVLGRVRITAPSVDTRTRTTFVYVDLPADSAFKAGSFAAGRFDLGASDALTVGRDAVVVRDGFSYLFTVDADARVHQRKVEVGRRTDTRVEVLAGLTPETHVVADGAAFLADGDVVRVVPPSAVLATH